MKWNEAQLSAINTRNKNILVSAAAGSGKTAVLTERIKRLIVDEKVKVEEMLIVTFTNAAAAEMKERIYKGISDEMDKDGADLLYLQEQLDSISFANISTFHSFCLDVIRDYFYFTDLNPDFKICDDAQQEIFAQETMDRVLKEFFDKEDNEDFLNFITKYSKPGNEKGTSDMIRAVYGFIKSLPEPFKWLEEQVRNLQESEDKLERETWKSAEILKQMVIRYDEIYMEKKLSVNQIDFNDIEHIALKILENPEPQNEYRERFKYIFIDEYQDTNSVQEELVSRIKRDDNLFMVGDVKQSIYQFRLADPQIFIDKYKAYKEGQDDKGIKIDLNRNFRSKPAVLESVNRVMKDIMTGSISGIVYDEESMLYPGIDYENTEAANYPEPPVEADIIVEDDISVDLKYKHDGIEGIKKAELEAIFVCNRIKETLGTEYFDSKANEVRTVTYNDIVVLMRSYRGTSEIYQEVFQREGIPAYIEGDDGYFETVEIGVFANLLRIISNIRQDIPLISVLHSVIFGFSADELSEIRICTEDGLFCEAFLKYCEVGEDFILREKCLNALNKIRQWKDESHYISLRDLLWKLAETSGFYDFIRALPLGAHRVGNLKTLINKAEKYQENTAQGLVGFVRYIEQLQLNSAPMTNVGPGGEDESYVRLMSIHKSKGLEFPVVIVAGAGKSFNHRKPSGELSFDRKLGMGLRFRDDNNEYYVKTQKQLDIDEEVKNKEIAEEMRILYVAMTRAREKLIIIGTVKKLDEGNLPGEEKTAVESKSFLEWISCPLSRLENDINKKRPEAKVNVLREFPWEIYVEEKTEEISKDDSVKEGAQIDIWNLMSMNEEKNNGDIQKDEKIHTNRPYVFESEEDLKIQDEVYERMSFVYKYKDAAKISGKYTATELNRILQGKEISGKIYAEQLLEAATENADDIENRDFDDNENGDIEIRRDLRRDDKKSEDITPAERGTITHKVMQLLDLRFTDSYEDISAQIEKMAENNEITERERSAVRIDRIAGFFGSDLGKRLKRAEKVSREKPFLLWVPYDEETGTIVQGIIDCFFEEDDGIVLIDYKTDWLPTNPSEEILSQKASKYSTQIDIYRNAIEESLGKKVKESYLYFMSVGESVLM